ncbi:hypothetical protein COB55_00635 [Candidatus Wolfebacteria bacterium]|nr:MAG: hypothetical protein COB55_00635 [Candidatus Wolfebacteria bacterium]
MIKTTLAFVVGFGVLIGGYVLLSQPNVTNIQNSYIYNEVLSAVVEADQDNDGLKDWEETLWGSDPNKPDTDFDGTNDGDEVAQGRNPVIAGPDDLITAEDIKKGEYVGGSTTDSFSEQFITEYFLIRERSGGALSESESREFIDRLITSTIDDSPKKAFDSNDFSVIEDNTEESIRKYGSAIRDAIAEYSPKNSENEYIIFIRAVETDDEDEIGKIDPIIDGYSNFQKALTVMDVPSTALALHVELTNTIANLRSSITGMRNIFTDPVGAVQGVQSYEITVDSFADVFSKLDNYFVKNNVFFGENTRSPI